MDYFKYMLMNYSTHKEISNLLQIHVEIDKPKVLIPPPNGKSYADQMLN